MIDFYEKNIIESGDIIILTNCFGHLQDYEYISKYNYPYLVFDNA